MFLFRAAEGIRKADGHYSGWSPARLMISYLFAKKNTSLLSLRQRRESETQLQSHFMRKV